MKKEEILKKARLEGIFADERSRSIADKAGSFSALIGGLVCMILYFLLKAKGVHPAALSAIWLVIVCMNAAEGIYKSVHLKEKYYKRYIVLRTLMLLLVLLLFISDYLEWK